MSAFSLLDPTMLPLVGVFTLSLLWWLSTRRPPGVPPGPGPALPLLGHLHLMDKDPRAKFRAWRRQYGDVFSLYMGRRLVVVLNGFPVIKEALVKFADVFSDRPHFFVTDKLFRHKGTAIINFAPILERVPSDPCKVKKILSNMNLLYKFTEREVEEHTKVQAEEEKSTDFIHTYINQIRKHEARGNINSTINSSLVYEHSSFNGFVESEPCCLKLVQWCHEKLNPFPPLRELLRPMFNKPMIINPH